MQVLQSPLVWSIVAAAVIAVIFAVTRSRHASVAGFKDVVKNPGYWDSVTQAYQEADAAAEAAKKWDEAKREKAIRHFLFDGPSSRADRGQFRTLRDLGKPTHTVVLAILNDHSLRDRLVKQTGKAPWVESPFSRACELLGESPPPEATATMAPFLKDPSERIRQDAVCVMGKTGDTAMIPYVRAALQDSNDQIRTYALMGLQFALKRDRLAEQCAVELFPDIRRLLEEGKCGKEAADLLVHLDSKRATEFFLSPSVFSPDSPIIHKALTALAEAKVAVPREKLFALIDALESSELKYPREHAVGEALRLLGQHRVPQDREFLEARMEHRDPIVAEGASAGLLHSHGLAEFEERIWAAMDKTGYDSLNAHQRYCTAVCSRGSRQLPTKLKEVVAGPLPHGKARGMAGGPG